jgi:hypothetical protein
MLLDVVIRQASDLVSIENDHEKGTEVVNEVSLSISVCYMHVSTSARRGAYTPCIRYYPD